ncbi:hypothetical protein N9137_00910 [Pseudomonadales bacterium]|nr:hypothetical protein [Pseudomonadales bacterium]
MNKSDYWDSLAPREQDKLIAQDVIGIECRVFDDVYGLFEGERLTNHYETAYYDWTDREELCYPYNKSCEILWKRYNLHYTKSLDDIAITESYGIPKIGIEEYERILTSLMGDESIAIASASIRAKALWLGIANKE